MHISPGLSLRYIIYQSQIVESVSDNDLFNIIMTAAANNNKNSITSILLVQNRHIIQYIEGSDVAVEGLFRTISYDTRHQNLEKLVDGFSNQRLFPNFYMYPIFEYTEAHTYSNHIMNCEDPILKNTLMNYFINNRNQFSASSG